MGVNLTCEDFDKICHLVDICPKWQALEEISVIIQKYRGQIDIETQLYYLLFSQPLQVRNMVKITRAEEGGYVLDVGNGRCSRYISRAVVNKTWHAAIQQFLYAEVITKHEMSNAINCKEGDAAGTAMKILWERNLLEQVSRGKYRVANWVRELTENGAATANT